MPTHVYSVLADQVKTYQRLVYDGREWFHLPKGMLTLPSLMYLKLASVAKSQFTNSSTVTLFMDGSLSADPVMQTKHHVTIPLMLDEHSLKTHCLVPRPWRIFTPKSNQILHTSRPPSEVISIMSDKIKFSPAIPWPTPFGVQKRMEELRGYLDPKHPWYRSEQFVNIKAVIQLYEDGTIDGSKEVVVMEGKIITEEEMLEGNAWAWIEVRSFKPPL
jgi:hypothetical protein